MSNLVGMVGAGCFLGLTAGALAADPAAPWPKSFSNTLGLEYSPDWAASAPNEYKGADLRVRLSHSFSNGFSLGTALTNGLKASRRTTFSGEVTLGYRFKQDDFAFGLTGAIGMNSDPDVAAYYFVTGTIDRKLDAKWTWNVVSARYRRSFAHDWITPKLATGVTYRIDDRQTTSVSLGYSWKDTGGGMKPDKIDVAVGYRLGF